MNIGFAKIDITPPVGTQMCGQLFEYKAVGIESNLYASAMYLDDGENEIVIVSCDVLVISNEAAVEIRMAVETSCGVSAENIILCATHTHSGPMTQEIFGMSANAEYIIKMKQNIAESVKKAKENSRIGQFFIAKDELPGFGFNRRFIMSDGTIETHPQKNDPHIISAEGADSKDITVFYGSDSKGEYLGAAVVFGCHSTTMLRDNMLLSSDYCGKLAAYVSKKIGNVPVLFLQGASGDICATNTLSVSTKEAGPKWAAKMGKSIGEKAVGLIERKCVKTFGAIKIHTQTINIPRRKIDPDLSYWAGKHKKIDCELPLLSDYGTELYGSLKKPKMSLAELFKTPFWANFYANEIKTLEKYRQDQPEMPFTIKIAAQSNWAIVTLPCELFVDWNNRICRESPFDVTSVITLANGWNGYIPTRVAFERKGGYETKEVTSTMLVPEAGDIILKAVLKMLNKVKTKF